MTARHALNDVQFGHVPESNGGEVTAHVGDKQVGTLSYWHTSKGELGIDDLSVDRGHRRQGIATGLYGHLHDAVQPGKTVVHDWDNMTDDSKHLSDHLIDRWPEQHRVTRGFLGELSR